MLRDTIRTARRWPSGPWHARCTEYRRSNQLNPALVVSPSGDGRRPHEVNIRFMDASQLVARPSPARRLGRTRASRLNAFRSASWLILPLCAVLAGACSSDHADPTEPGVEVPDVPQVGWSTPVTLFNAGGGRIVYAGNGRLFALGKTTRSVHESHPSSRSPEYYSDPRNIGRHVEDSFKRHGMEMPATVRENIQAAREGNLPKGVDL